VLGNGDIKKAEDVYKMLRETGCDGVLIGRASLGNPWIFQDVRDKTETIKNYEDVVEILIRHINLSVEFYGEEKGMREVKKHYSFYLKGIPDTRELRGKLIRAGSKNEVLRLIKESHAESSIV
ncbi:tRNA dihydrouridine synthase DusB, partial [bacterium (Candidatus Howlettbacteria) CG_4_10_14_0_8_um_filter_40_9]